MRHPFQFLITQAFFSRSVLLGFLCSRCRFFQKIGNSLKINSMTMISAIGVLANSAKTARTDVKKPSVVNYHLLIYQNFVLS